MTYDEQLHVAAEKLGHCRVLRGLVDEDIARQVLEAIGIVREEPVVEPVAEPAKPLVAADAFTTREADADVMAEKPPVENV